MKNFDYLLMDADGTLFDFARAERRALTQVFQWAGIDDRQRAQELYLRINRALWDAFERGEVTKDQLQGRRFAQLLEAMGLQGDGRAMNERYLDFLAQGDDLLPGALAVCRTLAGRCRLELVTNGISRVQHGRMARSALKDCFEHIFVSEDIGFQKPQPAYFEHCLRALGNPDPARCLVVGDSLSSDMAGGIAAGLPTCWFNPEGAARPADMPITYEIHALEELEDIV